MEVSTTIHGVSVCVEYDANQYGLDIYSVRIADEWIGKEDDQFWIDKLDLMAVCEKHAAKCRSEAEDYMRSMCIPRHPFVEGVV